MPNLALESFANNIITMFKIGHPIYSMSSLISVLGGSIIIAEDNATYQGGVIRKFGNGFQMYLPRGMSEEYEKFTIARLLGYLFMGMGYKLNAQKWAAKASYPPAEPLSAETEERLEYFAYALLMPQKLFIEKAQQYENDDFEREMNLMVKFFKVSRERIIIRSIQLGLMDAQ